MRTVAKALFRSGSGSLTRPPTGKGRKPTCLGTHEVPAIRKRAFPSAHAKLGQTDRWQSDPICTRPVFCSDRAPVQAKEESRRRTEQSRPADGGGWLPCQHAFAVLSVIRRVAR